MAAFWELMQTRLASAWQALRDLSRSDAVRKLVIMLAIAALAGPEIVAALELQILLELLGAALFITAFTSGARLLLLDFTARLRKTLSPIARFFRLRDEVSRAQLGIAALSVLAYGEWWLATVSACVASIQYTVKLVL